MLKVEGKCVYKLDNKYSKQSFVEAFNDWKEKIKDNKTHGYIKGEGNFIGNISHKIENPILDKDKITMEYTVLDTPRGKCLKELIKEMPEDLSIKPRVLGKYNPDTNEFDVSQIISFDVDYNI